SRPIPESPPTAVPPISRSGGTTNSPSNRGATSKVLISHSFRAYVATTTDSEISGSGDVPVRGRGGRRSPAHYLGCPAACMLNSEGGGGRANRRTAGNGAAAAISVSQ